MNLWVWSREATMMESVRSLPSCIMVPVPSRRKLVWLFSSVFTFWLKGVMREKKSRFLTRL